MESIPEQLAVAIQHHQSGRLQNAEQIYRQILQQEPEHPDALHLLGVIAHQVGRHDIAIDLIGRSIRIKGDEAHVHNNLGGAYRALRMFHEARSTYSRALELKPNYVEAMINLGGTNQDLGLLDESIAHFRRAVELRPENPDLLVSLGNVLKDKGIQEESLTLYRNAMQLKLTTVGGYINLGNTLKELGQRNDAVTCYRRSLELNPNISVAHLNLGVVLKELDQGEESIACYRRALELDPNCAEAFNNLGVAWNDRAELDEAISCFRRALELNPDYADAHNNLGISYSCQGNLNDAVVCYRRALELNPGFVAAFSNLGIALKDQGKFDDAIDCFRRVLERKPNDVDACNHLGVALKSRGILDEAAQCCRRALSLNPKDAETHNHLGNVLKDQGQLDEAIKCYRRAIELNPGCVNAHSNLVYTLLFCPDCDAATLKEEHRRWNEWHASPLAHFIQPHHNDRTIGRRLRIGYVSSSFRNHVVGRNLIPLIQQHDHQRFEICCYADVSSHDDVTRRFQAGSDLWRDTLSLSDEQLADQIRADKIDILVDLTLHMAQNRLLAFARKPAPLQMTFAGYPGTTGLTMIDYRLTDPYLDPPGLNDREYSEVSLRLSDSFWCYDPLECDVAVNDMPAIRNDAITFGCLNNFCKVNEPILRVWAQVLRTVDRSRMIILSGEGTHRERVLDLLETEGISRERVTFVGNRPRQLYLSLYHEIDIGLDTIPYNGHSTSLDSFWMGVPVVTLVGSTVVGRAGLCQLMNLGLPELIAESTPQFISIASDLARDLPRLRELRLTLRDRMKASPLMDAVRFTRSIEAAYAESWQRWCN